MEEWGRAVDPTDEFEKEDADEWVKEHLPKLHAAGVYHGDLVDAQGKVENYHNILTDGTGTFKLIDFGEQFFSQDEKHQLSEHEHKGQLERETKKLKGRAGPPQAPRKKTKSFGFSRKPKGPSFDSSSNSNGMNINSPPSKRQRSLFNNNGSPKKLSFF
jgi:hypothetical protein